MILLIMGKKSEPHSISDGFRWSISLRWSETEQQLGDLFPDRKSPKLDSHE